MDETYVKLLGKLDNSSISREMRGWKVVNFIPWHWGDYRMESFSVSLFLFSLKLNGRFKWDFFLAHENPFPQIHSNFIQNLYGFHFDFLII